MLAGSRRLRRSKLRLYVRFFVSALGQFSPKLYTKCSVCHAAIRVAECITGYGLPGVALNVKTDEVAAIGCGLVVKDDHALVGESAESLAGSGFHSTGVRCL
jgi:hypothetical protein